MKFDNKKQHTILKIGLATLFFLSFVLVGFAGFTPTSGFPHGSGIKKLTTDKSALCTYTCTSTTNNCCSDIGLPYASFNNYADSATFRYDSYPTDQGSNYDGDLRRFLIASKSGYDIDNPNAGADYYENQELSGVAPGTTIQFQALVHNSGYYEGDYQWCNASGCAATNTMFWVNNSSGSFSQNANNEWISTDMTVKAHLKADNSYPTAGGGVAEISDTLTVSPTASNVRLRFVSTDTIKRGWWSDTSLSTAGTPAAMFGSGINLGKIHGQDWRDDGTTRASTMVFFNLLLECQEGYSGSSCTECAHSTDCCDTNTYLWDTYANTCVAPNNVVCTNPAEDGLKNNGSGCASCATGEGGDCCSTENYIWNGSSCIDPAGIVCTTNGQKNNGSGACVSCEDTKLQADIDEQCCSNNAGFVWYNDECVAPASITCDEGYKNPDDNGTCTACSNYDTHSDCCTDNTKIPYSAACTNSENFVFNGKVQYYENIGYIPVENVNVYACNGDTCAATDANKVGTTDSNGFIRFSSPLNTSIFPTNWDCNLEDGDATNGYKNINCSLSSSDTTNPHITFSFAKTTYTTTSRVIDRNDFPATTGGALDLEVSLTSYNIAGMVVDENDNSVAIKEVEVQGCIDGNCTVFGITNSNGEINFTSYVNDINTFFNAYNDWECSAESMKIFCSKAPSDPNSAYLLTLKFEHKKDNGDGTFSSDYVSKETTNISDEMVVEMTEKPICNFIFNNYHEADANGTVKWRWKFEENVNCRSTQHFKWKNDTDNGQDDPGATDYSGMTDGDGYFFKTFDYNYCGSHNSYLHRCFKSADIMVCEIDAFTLSVKDTNCPCGNGVFDAGEECDAGADLTVGSAANRNDDDISGCSADCKLEIIRNENDVCPGLLPSDSEQINTKYETYRKFCQTWDFANAECSQWGYCQIWDIDNKHCITWDNSANGGNGGFIKTIFSNTSHSFWDLVIDENFSHIDENKKKYDTDCTAHCLETNGYHYDTLGGGTCTRQSVCGDGFMETTSDYGVQEECDDGDLNGTYSSACTKKTDTEPGCKKMVKNDKKCADYISKPNTKICNTYYTSKCISENTTSTSSPDGCDEWDPPIIPPAPSKSDSCPPEEYSQDTCYWSCINDDKYSQNFDNGGCSLISPPDFTEASNRIAAKPNEGAQIFFEENSVPLWSQTNYVSSPSRGSNSNFKELEMRFRINDFTAGDIIPDDNDDEILVYWKITGLDSQGNKKSLYSTNDCLADGGSSICVKDFRTSLISCQDCLEVQLFDHVDNASLNLTGLNNTNVSQNIIDFITEDGGLLYPKIELTFGKAPTWSNKLHQEILYQVRFGFFDSIDNYILNDKEALISIPDETMKIKSEGYSQGARQTIELEYVPKSTSPIFDYVIFQE